MKGRKRIKYKDIYHLTGIYGIRNIINMNTYIGKTMMNFGDRWDSHKSLLYSNKHSNQHLQRAWNKYGSDKFEFVIIEICNDSSVINELEIKYILEYRKNSKCYNISDGGDGGCNLGKHLSDETKKKIGIKNKINMTGRKADNKTKIKMSESQLKRYENWTDEDRKEWGKKTSQHARGYTWSDESKEKMKNNKNGAKYTIDQIREIRRLHQQENKTFSEISLIMNIPKSAVYLIATYKRWKNAV